MAACGPASGCRCSNTNRPRERSPLSRVMAVLGPRPGRNLHCSPRPRVMAVLGTLVRPQSALSPRPVSWPCLAPRSGRYPHCPPIPRVMAVLGTSVWPLSGGLGLPLSHCPPIPRVMAVLGTSVWPLSALSANTPCRGRAWHLGLAAVRIVRQYPVSWPCLAPRFGRYPHCPPIPRVMAVLGTATHEFPCLSRDMDGLANPRSPARP